MVASVLIAEGFLRLQLFRRLSFCVVGWDSWLGSLFCIWKLKGEIFLPVSVVQLSSMLSTGRLLTGFFVAAFKKNSRKRRAIIFNNAITIRGRCLSCKIPTAGKALGHSGKWDANIQDYLFLKIPESNNNNNHCSEQCIKWLVCYCLQEALGSPAKGPVQAKHCAGNGTGAWGLLQAPCPCSALCAAKTAFNSLAASAEAFPQVKALRRKETTSHVSP